MLWGQFGSGECDFFYFFCKLGFLFDQKRNCFGEAWHSWNLNPTRRENRCNCWLGSTVGILETFKLSICIHCVWLGCCCTPVGHGRTLFYKHLFGILSMKEHDMIIVSKCIIYVKTEGNSNLVITSWSCLLRSDSVKCTLLEASTVFSHKVENSNIWSCMKV